MGEVLDVDEEFDDSMNEDDDDDSPYCISMHPSTLEVLTEIGLRYEDLPTINA